MRTDVVDKDGIHGQIVAQFTPPDDEAQVEVAVGERRFRVPARALKPRGEGYVLPQRFHDMDAAPATSSITVPVVEEELNVSTRPRVESVFVDKRVDSRDEWVDVPTETEEVAIERVAINREVETTTDAHYEGETLVIPLYDEVVVTQKRLVLREEVRITKRRVKRDAPEKVTLRSEQVSIRRE